MGALTYYPTIYGAAQVRYVDAKLKIDVPVWSDAKAFLTELLAATARVPRRRKTRKIKKLRKHLHLAVGRQRLAQPRVHRANSRKLEPPAIKQ
jgi:thiamine pyrophosphate-dependent acetolactate synthase large subunit-like protein